MPKDGIGCHARGSLFCFLLQKHIEIGAHEVADLCPASDSVLDAVGLHFFFFPRTRFAFASIFAFADSDNLPAFSI
jgi:hypothetical protein